MNLSTLLAVLAALGSAFLVAVASVLQHRAGSTAGSTLWQTFRRPVWLAGAAAGVAGFSLHVVALSLGALSIVQPLLVTGLLFAVPLSHAAQRTSVDLVDLGASGAVVAGLALFQLAARPTAGTGTAAGGALAGCVAVAVLVLGAALAMARRRGGARARWLGFATGVGYGAVAGLLKATTGTVGTSGFGVLTSWPLWGFLMLVVAVILINQLAFNAGPLGQSLPLLTIVDPLVSVVIGAVAFGETLAIGSLAIAGQVLGFAVMTVGVVVLSRRQAPGLEPAVDGHRADAAV